jgi:hypothetical protein
MSYGSTATLLTPRHCAEPDYAHLSSGPFKVSVRGVFPHTDRVLLSSSASPGFLYAYSSKGGIDEIQFDPRGSLADKQQLEKMGFSERQAFVYRRVGGHTLLACGK